MPRLTEYELERLANIERNNELMKSLGLFKPEVAPSKAKEVRNIVSMQRISMLSDIAVTRRKQGPSKQ